MRIYSVNPLNFNGIKVIKKEDDKANSARPVQQGIVENWGRSLDSLKRTADTIYTTPGIKVASNPITHQYDGRDVYEQNLTNVANARLRIQQKAAVLDEAVVLASENIQAINTTDTNGRLKNTRRRIEINISAKQNDQGMSKVAGYPDEMSVLYNSFIDKVRREQQGEDVEVFNGILFFGPWGNGKTYITEAVAEETGCQVVPIILGSKKPEAKTKAMQNVFKEAQKSQERFENEGIRTILFIDEIEKLANKKSPVAKEFEEFIKTCSKKYHCSVFAATNDPLDLGVDLGDPDVFAVRMSIDPPNNENAAAVFEYGLKDYPKEGELDYGALAAALLEQGNSRGGQFNNGQIINICNEVWKEGEGKIISQSDIMEYIQNTEMKPEISDEMGAKFHNDYETLITD